MKQQIALAVIFWIAFIYYAIEVYFRAFRNRPIDFLIKEEFWHRSKGYRIFTKVLYSVLCVSCLLLAISYTSDLF